MHILEGASAASWPAGDRQEVLPQSSVRVSLVSLPVCLFAKSHAFRSTLVDTRDSLRSRSWGSSVFLLKFKNTKRFSQSSALPRPRRLLRRPGGTEVTSGGPFQPQTAVRMLFVGRINNYTTSLVQERCSSEEPLNYRETLLIVGSASPGSHSLGFLSSDFYFPARFQKFSSRKGSSYWFQHLLTWLPLDPGPLRNTWSIRTGALGCRGPRPCSASQWPLSEADLRPVSKRPVRDYRMKGPIGGPHGCSLRLRKGPCKVYRGGGLWPAGKCPTHTMSKHLAHWELSAGTTEDRWGLSGAGPRHGSLEVGRLQNNCTRRMRPPGGGAGTA